MGTIPNDIRRLLDDCELFVAEILQDEDLSVSAQETRKVLLNNFAVVHRGNPQEFPFPSYDASDYQDDGNPE
ncbi:hypothetical protein JOQ06_026918, partial [Pogonophryne albipinna]